MENKNMLKTLMMSLSLLMICLLSGCVNLHDKIIEKRHATSQPNDYQVNGKSYQVISAKHYTERGTASWYGRHFHRKRTSSGERYNMYKMTAAHKTLPLSTYVLVTNLVNGRQVVVRVNDRGPFVDNRLIDLSYAAAKRLGMLGQGLARVEVKAIPAKKRAHA